MKKLLTKRSLVIALSVLFLFIAWNREINLLYGMFALLASTLILSHLLPRLSLRGVTAERSLQATAFEGDEIGVHIRVQNQGRTSRHMVEVVDTIPAAEPGHQNPITFIARLSGRKEKRYDLKIECYKRGEYQIGPLSLRSAYPLGIAPLEKPISEDRPTLLIYPKVFKVAHLPLMARGSMPITGMEAVSKSGGSEEFFGIREYRQGDSLRYIHWPSTAKHSRLIVKEFEIRASTEVTLLMDLQKGSEIGVGKETTLEYAVKIAASIAKYVLERGHSLQFIGFGEQTSLIPYARGFHQLARILETLARVKADGTHPFHRTICQTADLLKDGGTVVLLFSPSSRDVEQYHYSLSLLRAKRIRPIFILIDRESFLDRNISGDSTRNPWIEEIMSQGSPVYTISKGDDLPGVFAE
jgi:uncharacterized protein (DUF58 family)